ncbi:hypothetical protein [Arthrobacter sp. MMS18-M83]|uniref:hypothetical protein n=1 Tax=Arthrobacter sp. MMS18-M83 TaxID=2996261 RepID=UPI00227D5954|nr:hypothetical protein [Arthrobacter sp. MMS18-M83]WAH98722.1 hypothetical protein OW521_07780 [Arthrobacter sp. MMS18-M83]
MSTGKLTRTVTADTAEAVTAPVLPADDRAGDGYDWMDTLEGTAWSVLPNWGSEGWDAGSWPHIILAVARTRDVNGELFGYGTCFEGDTASHWFRSQNACFEAITGEVFFHWASGQSDGPENLPAAAAELPEQDRRPYPGWTS